MSFSLGESFTKNSRRRRRTGVLTHDKVNFAGGLNLIDSADKVKPGELQVDKNYEPNFTNGSYTRVGGYEVFDGQPQPHLAEYWKLDLTGILGGPFTIGEVVSTTVSGDTATVANYQVDAAAADGSGWLVLTDLTAQVDTGETWTGASSGATGLGASPEYGGFEDEDEHDDAQIAAELIRRNLITTVGDALCSGPTRGVNIFEDLVYAFRDNLAGSAGTMWKQSGAGWVSVDLGTKIRFTTGTGEISEGDVITGASSGASCTAERIVLMTGFWQGGDGAGYIVTTAVTNGPFTAGENIQVSAVTLAVADATTPQEAQTLPPSGKYRFRNRNFGGNTADYAMYGTNTVGNAFEFDGTVFTLIETGMTTDAPTHVGVHRGHLLLAYPGGSLQHSGKNKALSFSPVTGADEKLAGDEIVGFIEEVKDVTFVFTREQSFRLEGFVVENLQLKLHSVESGAIPNTIQRIGNSTYLDDRGFTGLPMTDQFGDFASNQISIKVEPLVQQFISDSEVQDSVIHRGKSLYRCFFSTGEAIVIGFSGNKVNGITTIDYGLDVTATANGKITETGTNKGKERVFIGSTDGYVYETDVGRNFNGTEIEAYFVTHYHFSGSPEYNVRYRRCTLYMEGTGRSTIKVMADYNYNEDPQNFQTILEKAVALGGGRYGIARHDAFNYSSASKSDQRFPMGSHARNVSMIIYHKEKNEEPHTIHAVQYHMSKRRMVRS